MPSSDVIFFDIGETLGSIFDQSGAPVPHLRPFVFVPPVLERLRASGARLGLISNTGTAAAADVDRMLERADLLRHFTEPELRIYSSVVNLTKDTPAIFELAFGRALRPARRLPGTVMFVGESRVERANAIAAGLKAAPHPLLAEGVLTGGRPIYLVLRLRTADVDRLGDQLTVAGVVPLRRTEAGADVEVVALATDRAIVLLQEHGVSFEVLPGPFDAAGDDLYLLRGTSRSALAAFGGSGPQPVRDAADGMIVALAPGQTIDDFHVGEGHGHNLKLLADPALLHRRAPAPAFASRAFAETALADASLAPEELATLAATITEQRFEQVLRFVTGMDGRPDAVGSNRHVLSPQMRAVTDGLFAEFQRIGEGAFTVSGHRFEITGREARDVSGQQLSRRIELHNVIAELPGESDEVVLIAAHLDSTAVGTFRDAYDPTVHEAPGVDDDGSGVAAVLLIAEVMRAVFAGRKPARTLRFALFNAEEQGLIGSNRYARAQAIAGANIVAVFQMDMIAYNNSAPNNFEVHAGTSAEIATPAEPDVERASLNLADLVRSIGTGLAEAGLSILAPAQVIASPDPAAGRSDHASFHDRGYAAVAISEDFFPSPGNPADSNPNYHLVSDRVFDLPFATSLARVICAAALRTAQPRSERAFAGLGAVAVALGEQPASVSGRLVPTGYDTVIDGATLALRRKGAQGAVTVAEAAIGQDGGFSLRAPPGSYHVLALARNGLPLASTHETPLTVAAGGSVRLLLDVERPQPLTQDTPSGRRSALFADTTLSAAAVTDLTPSHVLGLAREMLTGAPADAGRQFAATRSAARSPNTNDDPMCTLCGTERLHRINRLAELQGYADPAIIKQQVQDILAMGESGFATRTHVTPNFVISYQTDGAAAVENDQTALDVMEPGSNPPRLLERLPASNVPAYVRLVAFWLERSLQFYTAPPFALRNPAADRRLPAFINSAPFGSAQPSGFFINNRLPAELVCAVAVHELFHMVQFTYDGDGAWRDGMIEGGATFAEDTVADLMNRYLDEAGVNFNGVGLLAEPNQSLFSSAARYKSSLFWRYLAEQRSRLVDEPTIGVDAYRRVIEECAENGYTTDSLKRAIRSLPFDAELCAFGNALGIDDAPASSETTLGNFALALYLKDLPTPPDARFGFRENQENIHIDDVVRLVNPDAPSTTTLVQVKRQRERLTSSAGVVLNGHVEAMASRYLEVEIAADVEAVDVSFASAAAFSGLVQVIAIEDGQCVRDIVRSDKRTYRYRLANQRNGRKLTTVTVVVTGGDRGGSMQVSLQAAAPAADVMITRWNSESGREYHTDPHGAAWTWVSPDLWFEPSTADGFAVKVRLHNKGGKVAENVSCVLAYRPGAEPDAAAPWLPLIDAGGRIARIEGERIEPGTAREFSLPWQPTQTSPDGIFTLRAQAACLDDANIDNNTAYSRLGFEHRLAFAGTTRDGPHSGLALTQALRGAMPGIGLERAAGRRRSASPARTVAVRAPTSQPRTRVETVARVAAPDGAGRRHLPGRLATSPAVTLRLYRPDGSLAPGATVFQAWEGPGDARGVVAGGGASEAGARGAYAGLQPGGPQAGLFAREFWGISRHEAIAAAAERDLSAKTAEAVARITEPLGEGIALSQLAGWADTVKRREPRHGDDADTVAFLRDPRNRAHDTWHYVNIPCQAEAYDRQKYPDFTRDDDVVQMIAVAVRVLAGQSDRFSPLNALRLVVHLVGDVHQPIHVGCGYIDTSSDPARLVLDPQMAAAKGLDHDRGGGRLMLPAGGNLHGYWDGRLGSVGGADDHDHDHENIAVPELRARFVQKLVDMTAASPAHGFLDLGEPHRWAERWATESLSAAHEAYVSLRITGRTGNAFKVSWEGKAGYDARCQPIANARLAAAVRNLAGLLNRVLGV